MQTMKRRLKDLVAEFAERDYLKRVKVFERKSVRDGSRPSSAFRGLPSVDLQVVAKPANDYQVVLWISFALFVALVRLWRALRVVISALDLLPHPIRSSS